MPRFLQESNNRAGFDGTCRSAAAYRERSSCATSCDANGSTMFAPMCSEKWWTANTTLRFHTLRQPFNPRAVHRTIGCLATGFPLHLDTRSSSSERLFKLPSSARFRQCCRAMLCCEQPPKATVCLFSETRQRKQLVAARLSLNSEDLSLQNVSINSRADIGRSRIARAPCLRCVAE